MRAEGFPLIGESTAKPGERVFIKNNFCNNYPLSPVIEL